jgi:hypothetical protein
MTFCAAYIDPRYTLASSLCIFASFLRWSSAILSGTMSLFSFALLHIQIEQINYRLDLQYIVRGS